MKPVLWLLAAGLSLFFIAAPPAVAQSSNGNREGNHVKKTLTRMIATDCSTWELQWKKLMTGEGSNRDYSCHEQFCGTPYVPEMKICSFMVKSGDTCWVVKTDCPERSPTQ